MDTEQLKEQVGWGLSDRSRKYYLALNPTDWKLKNKELDLESQYADIDYWLYENKAAFFKQYKKRVLWLIGNPKFPKRGTQSFKILVLLILQGNVSNGEMINHRILRYGARITDLRNMGWEIESSRLEKQKGTFVYSLGLEQSLALKRLMSEIHVEDI
jgi:hypothetical protein